VGSPEQTQMTASKGKRFYAMTQRQLIYFAVHFTCIINNLHNYTGLFIFRIKRACDAMHHHC